ncbi:MAG: class I SAM-dependent methyltransferase [Kordiimonadaceae bacterium]|nr:class I SAM-dependent methyltransferase [Kordiimonadaceae bacterium]MBO6567395.1 class I SAM-dependent methyltransferase [Kordiimonadaceae bacterium]MBO6963391.1 class I SAM-dependent methyltransferase [Kordiimonadaceae bacterium]
MKPIYDTIGKGYTGKRVPDPRIAAAIHGALGQAKTVLNVGAGTGSYEPTDRNVTALEPSTEMIQQRPQGAAKVVQGFSENIPFADNQFDAAMAVLTVHHWTNFEAGIREMQRVAKERLVILTFDPAAPYFWLADYLPEIIELDQPIMPPIAKFADLLGEVKVSSVPIPNDCTDGFLGAYWQRPHAYLDPEVRAAISTFAKLEEAPKALQELEADLKSGAWEERYGHMNALKELDIGYRLVTAELS